MAITVHTNCRRERAGKLELLSWITTWWVTGSSVQLKASVIKRVWQKNIIPLIKFSEFQKSCSYCESAFFFFFLIMWPVLSLVQLYPINQHALVTACAIHVLWLISPCTFAAQVSLLAILTKFLLLAGGAGLAELLALSRGAEQEVGMPLGRLQTLCPALCMSLTCTMPLQWI